MRGGQGSACPFCQDRSSLRYRGKVLVRYEESERHNSVELTAGKSENGLKGLRGGCDPQCEFGIEP